jgi:hypothetical protein
MQEYKDVYDQAVALIAAVAKIRDEEKVSAASSQEPQMFKLIRDLTEEIRGFKEAYMLAVGSPFSHSYDITNILFSMALLLLQLITVMSCDM